MKMRTYFARIDFDKDGSITRKDFEGMATRFASELSKEKADDLKTTLTNVSTFFYLETSKIINQYRNKWQTAPKMWDWCQSCNCRWPGVHNKDASAPAQLIHSYAVLMRLLLVAFNTIHYDKIKYVNLPDT